MSTIEELIQLQNFNVSEAKPLTIRGQYSTNTNVDLNKTKQSVSLLTTELNELNSAVKQSSLNTGANFSMNQWINDTKNSLLSNLNPSVQTLIGNQKPVTKIISTTTTIVTAGIQSALNQQDSLINQLENQVFKVLEKQNNVKIEKDENGNVTLVPILTDSAKKSLDNVTKILNSTITTLNKINTRISNEKPLKTFDDFVNNLSLEHVIDFSNKIISVLTLIIQIKITIRKTKALASAAAATSIGNFPAAAEYTEQATTYTASEQKQMEDLAAAQTVITIIRQLISFYQPILQSMIDRLKEILSLIQSLNTTQNTQNLIDKLNQIVEEQQQTQDRITRKLIEPEIIQIPKPHYAAKIVK